MRAVLLLSGGLDSALCLAEYRDQILVTIGFDYSQPHVCELGFAAAIAEHYGVAFWRKQLPKLSKTDDVVFAGRNAIMLAVAAATAQANGLDTVMIGCNADDAARFPDCRAEFIEAISLAFLAYGVRVLAPLLDASKADIVRRARDLSVPETWTCYAPKDGRRCGKCYACEVLANAERAA